MSKMADPFKEGSVNKALWMTNTFYFLHSTAKASLIPFLTIYLRYLGLSAIHTGIILGVRCFLTVCCGTIWTNCAKKFKKQRIVLMVSIYSLIGVFIALTFVPPADIHNGLKFCKFGRVHGWNVSDISPDLTDQKNHVSSSQFTGVKMTSLSISTIRSDSMSGGTTVTMTPSIHSILTQVGKNLNTKTQTTKLATKPTASQTMNRDRSTESSKKIVNDLSEDEMELLKDLGLSLHEINQMSEDELEEYLLTALRHPSKSHQKRHAGNYEEPVHSSLNKTWDKSNTGTSAPSTATWEKFKAIINNVKSTISSHKNQTFTLVLTLFVFGGLLGSPVDKLIDNCWFDFLDNMDAIEKYGQHVLWGTIGTLFAPTLVTTIIDHVPCILPFNVHNIVIHVFTFSVLGAAVFILALFYPMGTVYKKPRMKALVGKGIRTVCNNAHAAAFTVTMYIVGLTQAAVSVFLFWKIQDMQGGEMPMGVSLSVAALLEIIMYFLNKGLVRKLGNGGGALLALVIMSGRLVFYSFLPNPWLVVAGEAFYGFSNAILWHSVNSYPDFRINALVTDRSAANTIHTIYHAFGFSTGCIVSGVITDFFGIDRLFQGAAALILLWAIFFGIIFKFIPKKNKIQYSMLKDNDDSSDEDWLEVALKEVQ